MASQTTPNRFKERTVKILTISREKTCVKRVYRPYLTRLGCKTGIVSIFPTTDIIDDLHKQSVTLQLANESILKELHQVEFENSFASAMLMQNMQKYQVGLYS